MGSRQSVRGSQDGLDLHMETSLRERAIAIARAALPNESCGLLGGHQVSEQVEVASVHSVANSLGVPTAFALDGAEMIAAEEAIDLLGEKVVGVFHSHPAAAPVPSVRDLQDARDYDPFAAFVHVIVSMQGFVPQLRAYRYVDLAPVELSLKP